MDYFLFVIGEAVRVELFAQSSGLWVSFLFTGRESIRARSGFRVYTPSHRCGESEITGIVEVSFLAVRFFTVRVPVGPL